MAEPAFLLDANVCIYILRDGDGREARRLGSQRPGSVVTSAIVYAEVARGLFGPDGELAPTARRFFEFVPVQPFDDAAALISARLPFRRGSFDRLIAAHTIVLGLTLITSNTRDFADIPELKLENWSQP